MATYFKIPKVKKQWVNLTRVQGWHHHFGHVCKPHGSGENTLAPFSVKQMCVLEMRNVLTTLFHSTFFLICQKKRRDISFIHYILYYKQGWDMVDLETGTKPFSFLGLWTIQTLNHSDGTSCRANRYMYIHAPWWKTQDFLSLKEFNNTVVTENIRKARGLDTGMQMYADTNNLACLFPCSFTEKLAIVESYFCKFNRFLLFLYTTFYGL